ncbi:acetyl/propionyl/methylcrotonyl-CoA carboxylase subunit alpha [Gimibacter soli]|uniref:Biotin carboxylase N-terminal domain-containing protein n=1 Tax=Gimibacter soli TaxID=3024400 RepID=A0AAE9XRX7_9PROT|nr:biotin carboxylase N-terminal domain-containing protein [Gimibacter soli]WCL54126.1 biotin carboxylase N-terminal domain-containing protein [Gimibacter soli]
MIRRLMIANRGEIAVRIIRTARAMGIETVAVYSEADRGALHARVADRAVCIGAAPAAQSYLNIEAVMKAAVDTGADAIHPGYGFLSENAAFAKAVEDAGLIFVGPTADVIEKMGDKREARLIAAAAGVPCVPGYDGDDRSDERLKAEAGRISFPLMIKATAGGGGRGLRRVAHLDDFDAALASARREAGAAFGSVDVLLERVIAPARHVEVQVFGDAHGNVVHLGERDCSAQRRHQKVVEEAPCSTISTETRARLHTAAVDLAKAVGYRGAGTVEFLVGSKGDIFFLEMNTRLQVEHPVTEAVTGLDLVALQLRVAAGEALGLSQEDITFTGHAIEARLYAEDPSAGFLPQTGQLERFDLAAFSGRVDSGFEGGASVSPFYDPMLAKVIAHGVTRADAIRKLAAMLRASVIAGVTTNKAYLLDILASDTFTGATHHTGTLDENPYKPEVCGEAEAAYAAALRLYAALEAVPMRSLAGWRTLHHVPERRTMEMDSKRYPFTLASMRANGGWRIVVTGTEAQHDFEIGGLRGAAISGDTIWIDTPAGHVVARDVTLAPPEKTSKAGNGRLTAPMDGQVVAVAVKAGDRVKAGDLVCTIEAMKMEHSVKADRDGTIAELIAVPGTQVKGRALLARIESEGD